MAKSKGTAGRSNERQPTAQTGLFGDWIAKSILGRMGAWVVTPTGAILDTVDMIGYTGTRPEYGDHDQALSMLGRRLGWEDMTDLYGKAELEGYTTVRLWDMAFNNQKVISIRLGRGGGDELRQTKRILDKLSGLGLNIYTAYGKPMRADIGHSNGYYNGTVEDLMNASYW